VTVVGKKLLVLTAGRLQQSIIARARELRAVVVATDRDPEAPGLATAECAEVVDALDCEGILGVARKHGVDEVLAEQTDAGVRGAAYVAATDKWLMREEQVAYVCKQLKQIVASKKGRRLTGRGAGSSG